MGTSYDHHWSNRKNWSWGFYSCQDDPRLIVPKMPKWAGRTLNFAHRWQALLLLSVTILLAIAPPIGCLLAYGPRAPHDIPFWGWTLGGTVVISVFYYSFELKIERRDKDR